MSKVRELYSDYGQSVWLDYIDRDLLVNGGLRGFIEQGVRGVTSNPTIFCKAMADGTDYDGTISELLEVDPDMDEEALYQCLTVQDARMAADMLENVYLESGGEDGYVSLEVSPMIAFDTQATIEAARQLWQSVDRPNLMVKVPATVPGLAAIEQLIAEGVNVNVTLLFSLDRYKAVMEAFINGLIKNPDPDGVASVASFFISRVDAKVDSALHHIGTTEAKILSGTIAIANARLAYHHFRETIHSEQYQLQLQCCNARLQRLLWASTGVKTGEYSDVLYVEKLVGPNTVNTMTPQTLAAFEDHGNVDEALVGHANAAQRQLDALASLGISLEQIADELEREGVQQFADSHDRALAVLKEKRKALGGGMYRSLKNTAS